MANPVVVKTVVGIAVKAASDEKTRTRILTVILVFMIMITLPAADRTMTVWYSVRKVITRLPISASWMNGGPGLHMAAVRSAGVDAGRLP